MAFIRRCDGKPAIRPRSTGRIVLVCAAAFPLCFIGLVGCGTSSSSSGSTAPGGSPAPSSTCTSSSFVRRDHNSPATRLAVLVSAQFPSPFIPSPDVDLRDDGDPNDSPQEAHELAGDGNSALNQSDNDPFQVLVPDDQANIDQEATGVGLTEEVNLLDDEVKSGEGSSQFGQEVCNAISTLEGALNSVDNLQQLYSDLNLSSTGSGDVINVVENGVQEFTQAFGSCFDTLSAAEQIVKDLENLFC